jgi:hypothetical protein
VPEWDKDSPRLRQNLGQVLREIILAAERREVPTLEAARHWQSRMMEGLKVPDRRYVGAFRGEPGLERIQVRVGANYGVDSVEVSQELARFETKLQALVAELDALLSMVQELDADQLAAVIDLCAWVHAEWIRIHPFANGNGRTARLWAMSVPERSLHFGPRTSVTTPLRLKGLGFGLSCSCTLKYASSRGRGNVVIPKGFPRSVGRVESRLLGFPCFPYSLISTARFGNARRKITITAEARFQNDPNRLDERFGDCALSENALRLNRRSLVHGDHLTRHRGRAAKLAAPKRIADDRDGTRS